MKKKPRYEKPEISELSMAWKADGGDVSCAEGGAPTGGGGGGGCEAGCGEGTPICGSGNTNACKCSTGGDYGTPLE